MQHLIRVIPLLLFMACQPEKADQLRLNEIQLIGSHNSYKIRIEQPLLDLLIREDSGAIGLDYAHLSLVKQLDLGIRGLELDVLYDPDGGAFTKPKGIEILDSLGLKALPYDTMPLLKPGFKVFHIPDIDFRSHCLTFKGCLNRIKEWSKNHPEHIPIIVTINPKNSGVNQPGFTRVVPFNRLVLDSLDKEITEVFSDEELITPLQVKGVHEYLRDAILEKGWPALDSVRGRVLFVLDAGSDVTKDYLTEQDYSKPMFVNVDENHPQAGFFIINDPVAMEDVIKDRVAKGFMVRTRSDANTKEARTTDYTRFEAAKRSGAHLISTDYYLNELSAGKDFKIIFNNDGYARCNPVAGNSSCEL